MPCMMPAQCCGSSRHGLDSCVGPHGSPTYGQAVFYQWDLQRNAHACCTLAGHGSWRPLCKVAARHARLDAELLPIIWPWWP